MRRLNEQGGHEDINDNFATAVSDGNIPRAKALILRYKTLIDVNYKTPLVSDV